MFKLINIVKQNQHKTNMEKGKALLRFIKY